MESNIRRHEINMTELNTIAKFRHGFPNTRNSMIRNPCLECEDVICGFEEDEPICPVPENRRHQWSGSVSQLMCVKCGMGFTGDDIRDPDWPKNNSAIADLFNCPHCGAPNHPFAYLIIISYPPNAALKREEIPPMNPQDWDERN